MDGTAGDEHSRVRAAEIIRDESRRVASQVDELLDLSRVQSGQVEMSRAELSVSELVGLCSELLGVRAKDAGVFLEADVPQHLGVMGDGDRLEQIVSNLIDNALKHSPPGGRVRIVARGVGQEWVEISVSDEGPGIPGDKLDLVFDRFYQGAGVRTGAGLGLVIAREIVHAHGASIRAANGHEKGAVFTVRLPTGHRQATGGQPH